MTEKFQMCIDSSMREQLSALLVRRLNFGNQKKKFASPKKNERCTDVLANSHKQSHEIMNSTGQLVYNSSSIIVGYNKITSGMVDSFL